MKRITTILLTAALLLSCTACTQTGNEGQNENEEQITDAQLNDYLFIENGIIPLPSSSPYLAKYGVHFIYQQYEIGPYAMGLVSFTVPLDKIKPYLTAEALKLLK